MAPVCLSEPCFESELKETLGRSMSIWEILVEHLSEGFLVEAKAQKCRRRMKTICEQGTWIEEAELESSELLRALRLGSSGPLLTASRV